MDPMRSGGRFLPRSIKPYFVSSSKCHCRRLVCTEVAPRSLLRQKQGFRRLGPPPIARPFIWRLRRQYATHATFSSHRRDSNSPVKAHHGSENQFKDPSLDYKHHIANALAQATGQPPKTFGKFLNTSKQPDHGDFHLAMRAVPYFNEPENQGPSPPWMENWPESALVEKPIPMRDFLRFSLKPRPLVTRVISQALMDGEAYGFDVSHGLHANGVERKRMVIDFSSPNIAKPFHAGHLRSTFCGAFLANLYEKQGWDVVRINYLGDWGKQFGLLAVGFEKYGNEERLQEDPIGHLYDIYVKTNRDADAEETNIADHSLDTKSIPGSIHQRARDFFRKLEDGDADALSLWRRFRQLSIKKYQQTYDRLNIHFDKYGGESEVDRTQIVEIVERLKATGLVRTDNGALILDYPTRSGYALLQKSDGASVYLTRDMAEALARYETYKFDRMLYVVGTEQTQYFRDLFQALDVLGEHEVASKCVHVALGRVKGMSTRRGTAKFLDDILNDAADRMYEVVIQDPQKSREIDHPREVADTLGLSAIAIQDMKSRRKLGYEFDLNRMSSFIGDTGPYIQYTHARLSSIARQTAVETTQLPFADLAMLKEDSALLIVRTLLRWPSVLREAMESNDTAEPSTVVHYLFRLAHVINGSYKELRVLGAEPQVQLARMALYEAARQVLSNGLKLLGLTPLTRFHAEELYVVGALDMAGDP